MHRQLRFALSLAAFSFNWAAFSAEESENAAKARAILAKASAHLATQSAFQLDASIDYAIKIRTDAESLSSTYTVVFERPDKLSLRLKNEAVEFRLVASEGAVSTYISEYDGYTVKDVDASLPVMVQRSAFGPLAPVMLILSEFVEEKPFEKMLEGATALEHAGTELIAGERAERVRFSRGDMTFDIWVAAEGDPLVKRIVPDTKAMLRQFEEQGVAASLDVHADITRWNFAKPAVGTFTFTPPAGVNQVASFQPKAPASPADALLGKPAPPFALPLMDGGTLNLAALKGKEIAVLDFWATWCGPCRQAMPIIERVTGKFAKQGVRLYAVNLRETPKEIKAFLARQQLSLTVALDGDGSTAGKYFVEGIPQTVIIGKDGTVQAVHKGLSPMLEAELMRQLTALANGETLAP